ncbi:hypothetical protein M426DRAFT_326124 [Hypoxylon sp. CI-4A]|nr:hypothetical protein M426DRAFT_326124 [Hypoxylon sp. CI-4A]
MAKNHAKLPNPRPYYNYKPSPSGWIRLLRIHDPPEDAFVEPGVFPEDDIRIELHDYPLASCPDYTSLSYTWGDPTLTPDPLYNIFTKEPRCFPVHTDGGVLRGTRNLRSMLRRIRQAQYIRKHPTNPEQAAAIHKYRNAASMWKEFYWIDALCIDQDDLEERTAQVALMRLIYKRAKNCTIWVGEPDEHTSEALHHVMEYGCNDEMRNAFIQKESSKSRDLFTKWIYGLSKESIKALLTLFSRTWFSRVWVIQEAILAGRNIAGLCGSMFFAFEPLLELGAVIHGTKLLGFLLIMPHANSGDGMYKKAIQSINEGEDTFRTCSMNLNNIASLTSAKIGISDGSGMPNFKEAVGMIRRCQCTDPRDRIYGILSIVAEFQSESGKPTIEADYTLPTATVYVKATVAAILATGELGFLEFTHAPQFKTLQGLPSWCPDYNSLNGPVVHGSNSIAPFVESIWQFRPRVEVLENNLLQVDGFRYDTIAETFSDMNLFGGLVARIRSVTKLLRMAARLSPDRNGPGRIELLWRLLFNNQFHGEQPAPPVAGLFLPLALASLLHKRDIALTGMDKRILPLDKVEEIERALEDLHLVVVELHCFEPDSGPILPNAQFLENSIQRIKTGGQASNKSIHTEVFEGLAKFEMFNIRRRAADAGLTSELAAIIGTDPSVPFDLEKFFGVFSSSVGQSLYRNTLDFYVFATEKPTHLGMGQKSTAPKDEVWVLHGVTDPVILRPVGNGRYEYGGKAQIQGPMFGNTEEEIEYWRSMIQRVTIQ